MLNRTVICIDAKRGFRDRFYFTFSVGEESTKPKATTLMAAAFYNVMHVAMEMIHLGANLTVENDEGYTAPMYAKLRGNQNITKLFNYFI